MNPNSRIARQQIVAIINIALLLIMSPVGPGIAAAQQADPPPPAVMSPDKLDQLVAGIALYPDPLLAQVLAAVTFPNRRRAG